MDSLIGWYLIMVDLLYSLQKERWNWAQRGLEEYRSGFLRLKRTDKEKNRILIGVYGPTQVGKTTIILKIIGIKEEKLRELSRALRGKRILGSSATVTATVYQRSANEYFVIYYPDGRKHTCHTLNELEEAMSNIRLGVESKEYNSLKPLVVQISSSYFDLKELKKRKQDIEVLDLPGDDSKDKKEMEHVVRCLKEYLTQCRVCVLVEIADQMVSLLQIDRECVRDWQEQPDNFRIVLTRAASSSSMMKDIRDKKINSKEAFKHAVVEPLLSELNPTSRTVKVYPLEYGDSWEGLMETESMVYKKAKPWIDEIFGELYSDLCTVLSPETEIKQAKHLERLIIKRREEELKKLKDSKEKKVKEIENMKTSIIRIEENIKIFNIEKTGLIKEMKKTLDEVNLERCAPEKLTPWTNRRGFDEKRPSNLRSEFYFIIDKIDEYHAELAQKTYNKLMIIARKYRLQIKQIKHIKKDIAYYVSELPKRKMAYIFEKSFEDDYYQYQKIINQVNDEAFNSLNSKLNDCKNDLEKNLKQLCGVLEEQIKIYYKESKDLNCKIADKDLEIINITKQMQEAVDEWEIDKERCKQFNLYLKKSFIEQSDYLKRKLLSPETSPAEKWVYHQFLNIIVRDAERIAINE